ncbi:MAG TPA: type III-B CRISPR module RAMP protein Cmr4 [Vicinamibacterales bacterium]|nr:type III-B CRISPR module RAMP protein Cmr4 [Vicinamibacterales bacterium]
MYDRSALMFVYCVSPLHMGAGTALGAIDNPIQRERHTRHPMIVGSGIKGALRHTCQAAANNDRAALEQLWLVFGPETDRSSDHAGALSVSDAQIVCFPVRSLKHTFVYATSATALARLQRLVEVVLRNPPDGFPKVSLPKVDESSAVVLDSDLLDKDYLILEAFRFKKASEGAGELGAIARWLAENAVPPQPSYFAEKLGKHLVLLHDDWFNHFVEHATVVEPHVRIKDESGTADEGGLFYTENLPPESLLVSVLMASKSRKAPAGRPEGEEVQSMSPEAVLDYVRSHVERELVQLGGDATTGRGQVIMRGFGWPGKGA